MSHIIASVPDKRCIAVVCFKHFQLLRRNRGTVNDLTSGKISISRLQSHSQKACIVAFHGSEYSQKYQEQ